MRVTSWLGLFLLVVVGCSSSSSSSGKKADAGASAAGKSGSAGSGTSATGNGKFGAACKQDSDCGSGMHCDQEVDTSYPASGLPAGMTLVKTSSFPGGSCTPKAAAPYDQNGVKSCDIAQTQANQGCGANGECVPVITPDSQNTVACRPTCDPANASSCGNRTGYTCDFTLKACVEGCQGDTECRLQYMDTNGDGVPDVATYDPASNAICDTKTFRCVLKSDGPGKTGDPCVRLDDCTANGVCLDPTQDFGQIHFPGGYCSEYGCDLAGRDCAGQNAVCVELRPLDNSGSAGKACFTSCKVGADTDADKLGVHGHGEGCREGYRCHYNGTSTGVCVGGNYNDVTTNNVGASCMKDSDCYSPYGLGSCISLSVGNISSTTGVCTILDCKVPGLPSDVCGSNSQCINLSGDVDFCVKSCNDASECAAGQACTDDDGMPQTPKICYPVCTQDSDCAKGETCAISTSQNPPAGVCVASRT